MTPSDKKKLFRAFEEEARFWIDALGMKDWRWDVVLRDDIENSRATIEWDTEGRIALVALSLDWLEDGDGAGKATETSVRQSAFHEVAEVQLAEFRETILKHPQDIDEIVRATHSIIRRLENVLFPLKGAINKGRVNK